MTREQYKRANGAVFPIIIIIMAYLFLTMIAFIAANGSSASWRTYVQLATAVVTLIVVPIAYVTKGSEKNRFGYNSWLCRRRDSDCHDGKLINRYICIRIPRAICGDGFFKCEDYIDRSGGDAHC